MKKFEINGLVIHDINQSTIDLNYAIHTPVDGLDFPAIRLSAYDKPGEHGALVSNQLYGGRQIDLTGLVWGNTIQGFNENRRLLQAAIRIVKNNFISLPLLCKMTNDDGLLLQFEAYAQKIAMAQEFVDHANWFLTLFAPDPNLYDQNLSSVVIPAPHDGGVVYPIIYPYVYDESIGGVGIASNVGDANTYPIVYFNGPLTNPMLTNISLAESFKVNATIPAGHQLVVDMQKKTMVLDGITNYMFAFDEVNTWLSFVPGNNLLALTTSNTDDDGNVSIAFRSAYIGV